MAVTHIRGMIMLDGADATNSEITPPPVFKLGNGAFRGRVRREYKAHGDAIRLWDWETTAMQCGCPMTARECLAVINEIASER